ncbi:MAG: Gfo/Idh/MocA family oxidoreductase [Desulfobacterales bacterium]|nr:Gfo/Idh/MocA family oxidoreductase [Desulfobacterales bacterium]
MTEPGQRYLIVCLGSIGRRHLSNLRRLKPQSCIGVWRMKNSAGGNPPEGADYQFATLDQALEFAPVAAVVAGPASTHLSVARLLAEAGVHLFVEKPLADHLDGVADLITLCRVRGVTLMTGYNLRFLPSLKAAKACLDGGGIGRVLAVRAEVGQYLPDWRPGGDYRRSVSAQATLGGGALLELSHEMDYLCWFFGMPKRVIARGGRFSDLEIDVEDLVELVMEYNAPPLLVSVHLDMLQRAAHRTCRFIGSDGTLVWDGIADRLDCYRADHGRWETLHRPNTNNRNQMYLEGLGHFLNCIEAGTPPLVNGADGLRTLAIITAARHSIAEDCGIEVIGHGN